MNFFTEASNKLNRDNSNKILEIINTLKEYNGFEEAFTEGFCYDFAFLLWRNIPESNIVFIKNYDNGSGHGHYVLEHKGEYYDINGKFDMKDDYTTEEDDTVVYLKELLNQKEEL